jgi:meiotically up-regulated gene 157 (Mug157) protein
MLDEKDEFNEDPDNFIKEYCNENGLFNYNGFTKFLNKTVGIVSYLNRSSDVRQFAYPVISNVLVEGVKNNLKEKLEILEKNKVIEKNKEKLKEIKVKIKETKKDIKDDTSVLTVIDECIKS